MFARPATFSLLLAACSQPLDEMVLDFSAEPLTGPEVRQWSVAHAEGGYHRITVRRTFPARDACQDIDADLANAGHDLLLRVTSRPANRGDCPPRETPYGYTATIRGVPAGDYGLRVIHLGSVGANTPEIVMDHPIHVR